MQRARWLQGSALAWANDFQSRNCLSSIFLLIPVYRLYLAWDHVLDLSGCISLASWRQSRVFGMVWSGAGLMPYPLHGGKGKCCIWLVNKVEIHFPKIGFVDCQWSNLNAPRCHSLFGSIMECTFLFMLKFTVHIVVLRHYRDNSCFLQK